MNDKYRPLYDAVIKELADLLTKEETLAVDLEAVQNRIAEAKKEAVALGPLCGIQPWVKHPDLFPEMSAFATWGITALVRAILSKPPADWMTPVAVRDQLKESPEYKGNTKNLLPSVHTVLKRLVDAEEVERDTQEGRTQYRWRADAAQARSRQLTKILAKSVEALEMKPKRGLKNVRIGGK